MLRTHSIDTFGTHDGPGIRLVVFTQGCQFRCVYCHNPDTQDLETSAMKLLSVEQILALLGKGQSYYGTDGGLTVSGGEPTLQAAELIKLFTACKQHNVHTCLDTCGAIFDQTVQQLYDLTDIVLLDVKHIDPIWHQRLTKASNENVLKNAAYREQTGKAMWLRYVLVPGWTDQEEHLHAWARYFQTYHSVTRVELIPYHELGVYKYRSLGRPYALEGVKPPTSAAITQAATIFRNYLGDKVVVV
jgi:pyruvate formate lyase activating enzyme